MIAGEPLSFDEIWVIGDTHFLAKARKSLTDLKDTEAFSSSGRGKLPFILENFEVCIGSCHYSWCFTTQIRGGLATLLSTKWRLPNFIYILFSNDQIQEADILGDETYKVLEDLFTFINRAIIARKTELPKKSRRCDPPSITIVKTVAKPQEQLNTANFKNRRRSFNRALQKISTIFGWRSINIDTIIPSEKSNFDDQGELSDQGMKVLWNYLSEHVRMLVASKSKVSKDLGRTTADSRPGRYDELQHATKSVHPSQTREKFGQHSSNRLSGY